MNDINTQAPKKTLNDAGSKRAEMLRIPLDQLNVLEGFNPREDSKEYREHVEMLKNLLLAEKAAGGRDGWKDSHPAEVMVGDGKIYFTNGHSRFAAAKLANAEVEGTVQFVPAIAVPEGKTMLDLNVALVTSNSGMDLTPLGKSIVVKRLTDEHGLDKPTVAEKLQMSTKYVGHMLLLANAPDELHQMIIKGTVSASLMIKTILEMKDYEAVLAHFLKASKQDSDGGEGEGEEKPEKKVTAKVTQTIEQKAEKKRKALANAIFKTCQQIVDSCKAPPEGISVELWEELEGHIFQVERVYAGE